MIYRYDFQGKGKVGLIGFGGWQLGNSQNWDGPGFEESVALVRKAVESGVNFFDTAPNYGGGNSELILGNALKGIRNQVFINTKVGHGPDGAYEFTEAGIRKSIERSLERLDTDYLDSVILHNPERYILEGKTNLFKVLEEYKNKGVIKKFGVSIDTFEEAKIVIENTNVDTIEIMFNMIHQNPRKIFDRLIEKHIFLIVKVPLDSGWLSGKYGRNSRFGGIRSRWAVETIETRSEIVEKIKKIINDDDLASAALKFIASYPAVSTIIPGIKDMQQLEKNIQSLDYDLSKDKKALIEQLYDTYIITKDIPW